MRIFFVSEYFPPFAPGGAEWTNFYFARLLARRGHQVRILTPRYGASSQETVEAGFEIHRFPFPLKLVPGQREAPWPWIRNPFFYLYFTIWAVWFCLRWRPDIIHAQGKGALPSAWVAGRGLRVPVLFTIRDISLLCPLGMCPFVAPEPPYRCSDGETAKKCKEFFRRNYLGPGRWRSVRFQGARVYLKADVRLKQWFLKRLSGVVGVSRGILEVHPSDLLPVKRFVVPPPPPDEAPPSPEKVRAWRARVSPSGPVVFYAGKYSMGKGVHVLLSAAEIVRKTYPSVLFVFAGKEGNVPIPKGSYLLDLGSVPHEDVLALYRASDIVVQPSVWPEPLSRVIVEAMTAGRAVVATRVGGTPEIVEHETTGLLVSPNDAQGLADAVVRLLNQPETRTQFSESAKTRMEAYLKEDPTVRLEKIYLSFFNGGSWNVC